MEEKPNLPPSGGPQQSPEALNKVSAQVPPAHTPEEDSSTPKTVVPPSSASGNAPAQGDSFYRELLWSKRFWLTIVLLSFFLYTTVAVPVSKIPLLRTLVEAMGYTEQETHQISFFKALLTWNEHSKTLKAQEAEDWQARYSTAKAVNDSLESARNNPGRLLDLRAVNRSLQEQGKATEELTRAGLALPESTKDIQPVQMSGRERQLSTQPPSSTTASGEETGQATDAVFFGEDTDQILQETQSGFDTTKVLAGVQAPGTIDSVPTDWKLQAADSFWDRHRYVTFNNKLVNEGQMSKVKGPDIHSTREIKPRADVVYAWMTSRASRRTQNMAFKKTLSSAGFIGADLNRPLLLTSMDGTGVLPMDEQQIERDFNIAQDRVKLEEKCSAAMEKLTSDDGTNVIFEAMDKAAQVRKGLKNHVSNCSKVLWKKGIDKFKEDLKVMDKYCRDSRDAYAPVKTACRMEIVEGSCNSTPLSTAVAGLFGECNDAYQLCVKQNENAPQPVDCDKEMDKKEPNFDTLNKVMDNLTSVDVENPSQSYFSQVDWKNTLRNRKFEEQM